MKNFSPAMNHIEKKIEYHLENIQSKKDEKLAEAFKIASANMYNIFQRYFEEMNALVKSNINRRIKINILQSVHLTFDDMFDDFEEIADILGPVIYHNEFSSFISNVLDTKYKRCLVNL